MVQCVGLARVWVGFAVVGPGEQVGLIPHRSGGFRECSGFAVWDLGWVFPNPSFSNHRFPQQGYFDDVTRAALCSTQGDPSLR